LCWDDFDANEAWLFIGTKAPPCINELTEEEEEEEEKVDNVINVETERLQNGVDGESGSRCRVSELHAEKVEDQSWRFVIDEAKVDNENEDEDEENSLHRRILCSIVNWHGY
jgi:hypothetical protein